MPRKRTHELLAKLFARVPSLKEILARPFGVNVKTIGTWAQPVSSDENPFGWGNGNPLDRVEKLIREAHVYDPQTAREISENFSILADELDYLKGLSEGGGIERPCEAIMRVVESTSRLVKISLENCDDPRQVSLTLAKVLELKSYVFQLEGCLRGILQNEEK